MNPARYTLHELAAAVGVGSRTLRSWIADLLLPRPRGRGRGAYYDDTHRRLALATKALREKQLAGAELRYQLKNLDDAQIDALLAAQPTALPASTPPEPVLAHAAAAPPALHTCPFDVVVLRNGLWLMVTHHADGITRQLAEQIQAHALVVRTTHGA